MTWEALKPTQKQMQQLKKTATTILNRQKIDYDLWLYNIHLGIVLDNQSVLLSDEEDSLSKENNALNKSDSQQSVTVNQNQKNQDHARKDESN